MMPPTEDAEVASRLGNRPFVTAQKPRFTDSEVYEEELVSSIPDMEFYAAGFLYNMPGGCNAQCNTIKVHCSSHVACGIRFSSNAILTRYACENFDIDTDIHLANRQHIKSRDHQTPLGAISCQDSCRR